MEPPELSDEENIAIRIANLLSNGMGGYDWAGFELACAVHGVTDFEMLVRRMALIKAKR